ncbi:MAG: helix-turn-helix domain-containing protein [Bacteroidetes bacterium]|nr:helix-turn-helix domain-containing protein [Bacteroidota bacterium]MBU1720615.1 helix-turn-helix domain-containing protein [Bacteroidota bacterium]
MDEKSLSPSQLADEIGIPRASVSHLLSGRNNPSLDVITKILQRFPDVSPDWLLLGTGSVYRRETTAKSSVMKDANSTSAGIGDDCTQIIMVSGNGTFKVLNRES